MPSTTASSFRLSARIRHLKPSATFAVTARVKQMQAEGINDVIGFGAGEPDFDTPDDICQAAIDALNTGMTHYAPVPGQPAARAAIARKLHVENSIPCEAADICISTGAKQSLYLAMQCLVDPAGASEVILLTPAWVSYRAMVELAGGTAVEVPGAVDNDFKITPEQLELAITSRTAAVIVNSPSNPCGIVYTPNELKALGAVLAKHEHVAVISDEIYEKLIYADVSHFSLGSIDALAARTVTINGLSKSYAMTGWRIGYACGPGGFAKSMATMQGQMTSNITSFCYPAITYALEHGGPAVAQMRAVFAERATLIDRLIGRWPDTRCPSPTAAFYAFPDIGAHFGKTTPEGRSVKNVAEFAGALLEETHVAVVPGADFGDCAQTHVRLSFATSEDKIVEGCERIEKWLGALK